jgi:signal transduction histidine kinase
MTHHPAIILLLTIGLIQMWMMPAIAWLLLRGQRDSAAQYWFAGTACYAGTSSLFVLDRFFSADLNTMIGFFLVTCMLACFVASLRLELQNGSNFRPSLPGVVLANVLVIIVVHGLWGMECLRVVELVIFSVLDMGCVYLLLLVARHRHSMGLNVVVLGFLLVIVTNLARVYTYLASGASVSLLTFSPTSTVAFIANYLSVVFYSFGYWGFVIEKNRAALVEEAVIRRRAQIEEKEAIRRENATADLLRERDSLIGQLANMHNTGQFGALAASVVHEISQPLASLRLDVEEAVEYCASDDCGERFSNLIKRIASETRRATATISTMRNIFKINSAVVERQSIDEIILVVCGLFRQRFAREQVILNTDLSAPGMVSVGVGELEHVVLNLLVNSLGVLSKHSINEPRISIASRTLGDRVSFTVKDNGPGVPAHLQKDLFQPIATACPSGLGLGLWLSRYIVERNNGQLVVDDVHQGGGASFTVTLPLSDWNETAESAGGYVFSV